MTMPSVGSSVWSSMTGMPVLVKLAEQCGTGLKPGKVAGIVRAECCGTDGLGDLGIHRPDGWLPDTDPHKQ